MKGILQLVAGTLVVAASVAAVILGAGPSVLALMVVGGIWIVRGVLELRP